MKNVVVVSSDSKSVGGSNKEADVVRFLEDPDTMSYFELEKIVQKGLVYNSVDRIYFYTPESKSFDEGVRLIWDNSSTIDMLEAIEAQKLVDQVVEEDEVVGVSLGAEGQFTDKRLDDEVVGVSLGAESQFNDKRLDDRGARVSLGAGAQFTDKMPDDEVAGPDDEGVGVEKAINDELVQDKGEVETSVDDELVEDECKAVDDDNVYLVRVRYQVDGEGDEELEAAREKLRTVFKDGKEFREGIHKYSLVSRKALKFVRNEPYRIRVKCIAVAKCPWVIFASYSKIARGKQVKTFNEDHSCATSLKNKLVDTKMCVEQLETDIKDHPKLKLKNIQLIIKNQLHVDVNLTRCKRVTEKLGGNYLQEFTLLQDYPEELLDKNLDNIVIINVDRVTLDSPSVFKKIYMF
ncbi:hypothetical protein PTKIN_Ptkin09bG0037500 [Pterospermum kingtungense]